MATIYELRSKLVKTRNSFRALKGGLGNITATSDIEIEWLEWARDNSDRFREELNDAIACLDELIGEK